MRLCCGGVTVGLLIADPSTRQLCTASGLPVATGLPSIFCMKGSEKQNLCLLSMASGFRKQASRNRLPEGRREGGAESCMLSFPSPLISAYPPAWYSQGSNADFTLYWVCDLEYAAQPSWDSILSPLKWEQCWHPSHGVPVRRR